MPMRADQLLTTGLAVVVVWLAASSLAGSNGLTQLLELRRARDALALEVIETGNRIAALERTRNRLRHDPGYLEEVARTELGLVYRDEVVYRFRDPGAGRD